MNTDAILSLIGDLYAQIATLQVENRALQDALVRRTEDDDQGGDE